jgi:hypothetical protein
MGCSGRRGRASSLAPRTGVPPPPPPRCRRPAANGALPAQAALPGATGGFFRRRLMQACRYMGTCALAERWNVPSVSASQVRPACRPTCLRLLPPRCPTPTSARPALYRGAPARSTPPALPLLARRRARQLAAPPHNPRPRARSRPCPPPPPPRRPPQVGAILNRATAAAKDPSGYIRNAIMNEAREQIGSQLAAVRPRPAPRPLPPRAPCPSRAFGAAAGQGGRQIRRGRARHAPAARAGPRAAPSLPPPGAGLEADLRLRDEARAVQGRRLAGLLRQAPVGLPVRRDDRRRHHPGDVGRRRERVHQRAEEPVRVGHRAAQHAGARRGGPPRRRRAAVPARARAGRVPVGRPGHGRPPARAPAALLPHPTARLPRAAPAAPHPSTPTTRPHPTPPHPTTPTLRATASRIWSSAPCRMSSASFRAATR